MPDTFTATIEIIGVNPFVFLPERVLRSVFRQAGRDKGKIPVNMKIDGHPFIQTLIKYSGHWRLYLNGPMRAAAGKETGDTAVFEVEYDPVARVIEPHSALVAALRANAEAQEIFDGLRSSLQFEIVRYISRLKTAESVDRNVRRAINFLLGKERFIGRDKP